MKQTWPSIILSAAALSAAAAMTKTGDVIIRDPFVLANEKNHTYYLYGTTRNQKFYPQLGYYVWRSRDLENWEGPFPVFLKTADFWATHDYWAPEVHRYRGKYYMFCTMSSANRMRGTQILVSESPEGPFKPISDGPVTPAEWSCLDGTLCVDDNGKPWIVFCHEWTQIRNGSVEAMPLTEDLTAPAGKPVTLFHAGDAPWVRCIAGDGRVTDGPFLFKKGQRLYMLWSSFGEKGYAMGIASCRGKSVTGPWHLRVKPCFAKDGGHGMLFRKFDGTLMLTLHQPNSGEEHPRFFPFKEAGVTLP